MKTLTGLKRVRENNNEKGEDDKSNKRIKNTDNLNIIETSPKKYKTIQEIKLEAIDEYKNLNEIQKKNNTLLLKINDKFDILEDINYNILINDLNEISENANKANSYKIINDNETQTNNFLEDYKKYRYTLETKKRIELLNKYLNINENLNSIIFDNESKDPQIILKELLLKLNELYLKASNTKPLEFINEYKNIRNNIDYDLKEKFFAPSNFGNLNYKYSLLISDFLQIFNDSFYKKKDGYMELEYNNSNIKKKLVKRLYIIDLFSETIENKDNVIVDEFYYRYLRIIYFIIDIYRTKKNTFSMISIIEDINNCMVNLIKKEELKDYIKKNPKTIYTDKNDNSELNEINIDKLLMDQILYYKYNNEYFEFDIKKYNSRVLSDLNSNLINKKWIYSNFKYIEEYNFIYRSNDLKKEFNNFIIDILKSPYIKKIYLDTETRFNSDNGYIFDENKILEEILKYIHFIPFPFDDVFGYADKSCLDIYITMYDNYDDTLVLLGKLYANTNDACHEIFHISSLYNIMNSDDKNFSNFYSKFQSKKKKKYVEMQNEFLKQINSNNFTIKDEYHIDFGDAIEIQCYGFCIREFTLYNVLNLFNKNIWYSEEMCENFKEMYVKRSVIKDDNHNKNNKKKTQLNISQNNIELDNNKNKENNKEENNIEFNNIENCRENTKNNDKEFNNIENNLKNTQSKNINEYNNNEKNTNKDNNKNNIENNNTKNDNKMINIKDYISKNKILKIFFDLFEFEFDDNILEIENIMLLKRKREFNNDYDNIIYQRELCLTPHTNPKKE